MTSSLARVASRGMRRALSTASGQVRVGIIGAGRIGRVHAETLARNCPEATAVKIVDFFPKFAEEAATEFNIPEFGQSHMEIIEDPSIDAVWICSPSSLHKEQIVAAAKAGKHIFCEKPLAVELSEADEVIEAVESSGVKMMLAFQRRFDPEFARAKEAIVDGAVGKPVSFRLTSRDPAPPPIDYILKSGGLHNDMAIHDIDIARFLMACECTEVTAFGGVNIDPEIGTKGGDIDTAITILKFENGAIGTIDNCRQSPMGYDQRVEVFGNKGQISFGNVHPNSLTISDGESVRRDKPYSFFMDRYMTAYKNETIEFVKAIVNDTKPPTSARDGKAAMIIAKAAKKSYDEKRTVLTSEITS